MARRCARISIRWRRWKAKPQPAKLSMMTPMEFDRQVRSRLRSSSLAGLKRQIDVTPARDRWHQEIIEADTNDQEAPARTADHQLAVLFQAQVA